MLNIQTLNAEEFTIFPQLLNVANKIKVY